ncbi:MAG: type II secretion system F family protein [Oscillospiraceae bacterium]|nr:type II secretion system F family protein [Oscillospiraceae bacterium]
MKPKSLTNTYLSMFCMEMAVILQAGIDLRDGLLMLIDEADRDGTIVLKSIQSGLDKGESLSNSLRASGYFPSYMAGMIETGEKTGRIGEALGALAEYYERRERAVASIKNAVFYPVILLIMMIAVVLVLIIQVLPIFNDVFGRLGARMSPLAISMMMFGGWISGASVVFAAIFGVLFIVAFVLWLLPSVRDRASKAVVNRFGARSMFGEMAASHYVSAMALSVASGLGNEEGAEVAATVSGGVKAIDNMNAKCLNMLSKGSTLSEAMGDSGILSARDVRMLALAERAGMVSTALADIARRKDRDIQGKTDRVIGRIEPTLIIVTAVIVGTILLSVMLPLMGIMTSIG